MLVILICFFSYIHDAIWNYRCPVFDCNNLERERYRDDCIVQVELQGCGVIYSNESMEGGYYYELTFLDGYNPKNATYFRNRDTAVASIAKQAIENKRTLGTYWAVDVVGAGEDACYALAQCHGYLPPSDCAYCLSQLASPKLLSLNESRGLTGARVYFGRFYARYEPNIFFNANNTPTLLTSLGPSSSPPLAPLASPLPGAYLNKF